MKAIYFLTALGLLLFQSCSENIEKKDFNFFLHEPCMILNYQQDNTIEGDYLYVEKIQAQDSAIEIHLPKHFFINQSNASNWVIGWGSKKPLFDAGCENIREIKEVDQTRICLGALLRGKGFPEKGERVVFWNKNPSGFANRLKKPIIDPSIWPQFAGKSISFGTVVYDSLLHKWVMFVNECDTSKIQIYAAMSNDLISWKAANNGDPVLKASDFKSCIWAGRDKRNKVDQTPFVSDIVRYKGQWHLFLDGYSKDGKRHIGIASTNGSLLGPYKISERPILSPGKKGSWNDNGCFYAKVKKHKEGFILFYDGRDEDGYEQIGMARSIDLIKWENSIQNPVIDQHTGWRSAPGTTEPNHIEIREDTILLMVSGVKKFKMGAWHHYVTKRMYLDKSGNVDDAQLGIFSSTDGGKTFIAHSNNPIFTNDYSNRYENEHLGGNFVLIDTDSMEYLFYQAKSNFGGLKYNIMLRQRKKQRCP